MYHFVVHALFSFGAKPAVRQGRKATGFMMKQPGCLILTRLSSNDRPVFFMGYWGSKILVVELEISC